MITSNKPDYQSENNTISEDTGGQKKKNAALNLEFINNYSGSAFIFLLIVQVVTGMLLVFYYKGYPELAFESVLHINSNVNSGWFIKSLHTAASNAMIICLMIYMLTMFLGKLYYDKEWSVWITGFILLLISAASLFTGKLLPWSEASYYSTMTAVNYIGEIPLVGNFLRNVFTGGDKLSSISLPRFYGLHISVIPIIFIITLVIHLMTLHKGKVIIQNETLKNGNDRLYFPQTFLLRNLLIWALILAVIVPISIYTPWEPGNKMDELISEPKFEKPGWYFNFMLGGLNGGDSKLSSGGGNIISNIFIAAFVIFGIILPFVDKNTKDGKRSKLVLAAGAILFLYFLSVTIIGFLK